MVELDNNYARMCRFDQSINRTYCVCDFRINIHRCDHNEFFVSASWITLVLALINSAFGAIFLYYLVKIKRQPFFLPFTRERGIIRPKPIHTFHLLVLTYNLALAFNVICLITESYPRVMWAELGCFLPLAICGSLAIFNPLSLVYSTPSESGDPDRSIAPNKKFLDIVGFVFIIHPYILFIPSVILSGYYSDINDFENARLISIINYKIKVMKQNDDNDNNYDINIWKRAKKNINSPMLYLIGGTIFQIILSTAFAVSYKEITIFIDGINILYYICWNIFIPFAGLISEISFLYNILFLNKKPKWWSILKNNSQQNQIKNYEFNINNSNNISI
ncbi:hypothetical protein C1645_816192 [Glomus cerebriforme]|uniref:G-protein coupled receptors family 1 profile domain-containing protein n=1 Tax=Glomus cerebriforme TaxID=658196 RepID=A0A397TLM6_9GLOM|nr:hypothetical protein C1645_816192 [Glomus cerebriforme]